MLVLQLSPGHPALLGPFRTRADWEVCEENGCLWLRCPLHPANLEATAVLPCVARYRADLRGRLVPLQGTVPVGTIPSGPWQPLAHYLPVASFPALLPGRTAERFPVTMERSCQEVLPAALLLQLTELLAWADQASRIRLRRLKFAVAADGRVLVLGTPLPALPGIPCYLQGRLILPGGWGFAPPVQPGWVEEGLTLAPGATALVDASARIEIISQEAFVPLTLAALRRSLAALSSA